jgi:hypothetical protein
VIGRLYISNSKSIHAGISTQWTRCENKIAILFFTQKSLAIHSRRTDGVPMISEQAAAFEIEERKHEVARLPRVLRAPAMRNAIDERPAGLRGALSCWPFSSEDEAGARGSKSQEADSRTTPADVER